MSFSGNPASPAIINRLVMVLVLYSRTCDKCNVSYCHNRNRIITNEKLYKMEIADSMMCKTCLTEVDTIKHAFLECSTTVTLWKQVEQWAKLKVENSLKINDIDKIFGHQMKNEVVDKLIMITKIVIYQNRMKNKPHHLMNIKRLLFNELITEEYEANLYQTENRFQQVWGRIYNDLKETFLS